jgi:hypothetical protein
MSDELKPASGDKNATKKRKIVYHAPSETRDKTTGNYARQRIAQLKQQLNNLRNKMYSFFPNPFRNLPKALQKHIISFLDKRPLDYLMILHEKMYFKCKLLPDNTIQIGICAGSFADQQAQLIVTKNALLEKCGRDLFWWKSEINHRHHTMRVHLGLESNNFHTALEDLGRRHCFDMRAWISKEFEAKNEQRKTEFQVKMNKFRDSLSQ